MTPAARLQAAIDLVDWIADAARSNGPAADTILARWFKDRRFVGSKDRAAIRELVYTAIRAFGEPPQSARAAFLGLGGYEELFTGDGYGPPVIRADEPREAPTALVDWLAAAVPAEEHAALLARATLDLRVNHQRISRDEVLAALEGAVAIDGVPHGVRLLANAQIEQHPLWRDGAIEIQDAGSQLIAVACTVKPGMTVVDLCAGAGGKTLALAANMAGQGRLIACDTDRTRLQRLPPRAQRAGVEGELRLLNPGQETQQLADLDGLADVVLVDAPCSGSGTWRRNPEARWRLTPITLDKIAGLQSRLLTVAARLVKPGGSLVYAVCSLIDQEGADQISAFLSAHPDWQAQPPALDLGRAHSPGWRLSPANDECDGFFIARLQKAC